MIDIHVLTHSGTRPEWLAQCLASLEGQPCTVHVLQGVEGSVGAGRALGYALGQHEFVGYLDSDDYLLPGALAHCLDELQQHHAVVTREWVEYPDGSRHPYPKPMHGIAIYRRRDIETLLPAIAASAHTADMQVRRVIRPKQLSMIGHVWRVHEAGNHHNVTREAMEMERAAWL